MTAVRALGDPPRRTNDQAIADLAALEILRASDVVLDTTYGRGRFWNQWRPGCLMVSDLNPARVPPLPPGAPHRLPTVLGGRIVTSLGPHDFRHLPLDDAAVDVVVFDPPYKLNGTSGHGGPASSDADYGVDGRYRPVRDRHALIAHGIVEAARVARRLVLVKCADQVNASRYVTQVEHCRTVATAMGLDQLGRMFVVGYRAQPSGRAQLKPHNDVSELLIFEYRKPREATP